MRRTIRILCLPSGLLAFGLATGLCASAQEGVGVEGRPVKLAEKVVPPARARVQRRGCCWSEAW